MGSVASMDLHEQLITDKALKSLAKNVDVISFIGFVAEVFNLGITHFAN